MSFAKTLERLRSALENNTYFVNVSRDDLCALLNDWERLDAQVRQGKSYMQMPDHTGVIARADNEVTDPWALVEGNVHNHTGAPCKACNGSGWERRLGRDNDEIVEACSVCNGDCGAANPPVVDCPQRVPAPAKCCLPTETEKELLASGEYTPEELWGGREPTCPKCFKPAPAQDEQAPNLQIVGYAVKSHLAPFMDESMPNGKYSSIGLDHPTCWLDETPYGHLIPLYVDVNKLALKS